MGITKKADYEKMVDEFSGSYPVFLTTDGITIGHEHDPGYDQFSFDNVVIDELLYDGDWPSYTEINRRRILVKKGFRGQELKNMISRDL